MIVLWLCGYVEGLKFGYIWQFWYLGFGCVVLSKRIERASLQMKGSELIYKREITSRAGDPLI